MRRRKMWLAGLLTAGLVAQSIFPAMAAQSLDEVLSAGKTATASNATQVEITETKATSSNVMMSLRSMPEAQAEYVGEVLPELECTEEEWEVLALVNRRRHENGQTALFMENSLQQAAHIRAEECDTSFSHTRPDGTSCFTVLNEVGASYNAAAENIAQGQKTPAAAMTSWMNSTGHKANILSSNYNAIGIGEYDGTTKNWVQMFVGTWKITDVEILETDAVQTSYEIATPADELGYIVRLTISDGSYGYMPLSESICNYDPNQSGTQTVTVTYGSCTSDSISVTLGDKIFEFAEKEVVKYVGDANEGFRPTIKGYSTATVSYESSNPEVVTVDNSGILTIKKAGSAVITATLSKEASKPTAAYKVTVPERELNFTQNPVVVPLGESITLPLEMKNFSERSTARGLVYEIEDTSIIKMESAVAPGKVSGQKLGSTALTVSTEDGLVKTTVQVTVSTNAAISGLTVTNKFEKAVTLSWNMTGATYYKIYRKAAGEEYVQKASGTFADGQTAGTYTDTTAQAGTTYTYKVVALAFGGLEADAQEIGVTVDSKSITLNAMRLYPRETVLAEPKYSGYTTVPAASWSVSDTSIATVDSTGKVTALKVGQTKLTLRLADGNTKTATVSVTKPDEVTELKADLNLNHHVQISWTKPAVSDTFYVYRKEGTGSWSRLAETKDTSYVDENAQGGHTYQYKVTRFIKHNNANYETEGTTLSVSTANQTAEVTEPLNVVRKGQSYQIPLKLSGFAQAPTVKYTSSNTSVATVDASGKVSIKAEGRADITIEITNGPTLTCTYFCAERPSGMYTAREWQVFTITNQNRMNEDHDPLSMFPQMQKATDLRKKELVTKYAHTRPDGSSCFTAFDDVGLEYRRAAENIAQGQTTPSQVMTAWMNSSGHYKNIMGNYQHFATGETSNHWVQMFVGCDDTVELMTMAPASGNRSFQQGTKIENFGEIVVLNCDSHGNSYMPLISQMCTGYNPNQIGKQTITVHYKELTTTFEVTITKATTSGTTGSSGGSGGGGGGGSSSGGGGGSSSGGGGGSSSGGSSSGNGPSGGGTIIIAGNGGSGNSSSGSSRDTYQGANWSKRDEKWYLVKTDGSYVTGWALKNGAWYYMNQGGDMKTGWLSLNNIWYYLNPDGDMKTGWLLDNGKWYYLNPSGDMKTGWLLDNGKWYFLNPNGDMAIGWIMDNGKYYCLDGSGAMYANTKTPDGYFVDASGARQ